MARSVGIAESLRLSEWVGSALHLWNSDKGTQRMELILNGELGLTKTYQNSA